MRCRLLAAALSALTLATAAPASAQGVCAVDGDLGAYASSLAQIASRGVDHGRRALGYVNDLLAPVPETRTLLGRLGRFTGFADKALGRAKTTVDAVASFGRMGDRIGRIDDLCAGRCSVESYAFMTGYVVMTESLASVESIVTGGVTRATRERASAGTVAMGVSPAGQYAVNTSVRAHLDVATATKGAAAPQGVLNELVDGVGGRAAGATPSQVFDAMVSALEARATVEARAAADPGLAQALEARRAERSAFSVEARQR
jgi:hypothetical protein